MLIALCCRLALSNPHADRYQDGSFDSVGDNFRFYPGLQPFTYYLLDYGFK